MAAEQDLAPPDGEGAGQITLAADGKRAIWHPRNGEHHWITADMGGRWQPVKGLPKTAVVEADRVDEGIYYGFDAISGKLYVSGNGGVACGNASTDCLVIQRGAGDQGLQHLLVNAEGLGLGQGDRLAELGRSGGACGLLTRRTRPCSPSTLPCAQPN